MKAKINKVKFVIVEADILLQSVEGLVNDTNPNLSLPSTWIEHCGNQLIEDLYLIGFCDVGSAIVTHAGNLPYQHIIHAVGPKWGEPSARGQLANTTWRVLQLAEEYKLKSIAVPPISIGINGYPIENCARTMLQEMIDFTFEPLKYLRHIHICADSEIAYETFSQELAHQTQKLKESGEGKVSVSTP